MAYFGSALRSFYIVGCGMQPVQAWLRTASFAMHRDAEFLQYFSLRRLNPYLDAMDFSSLETFAGE